MDSRQSVRMAELASSQHEHGHHLGQKDCNGPTPKPVTRTRNSFGPSVVEWVGTAGMDGDDGGTRKSAVKLQRLRQEQEFTSSHAQTTRPTPDIISIVVLHCILIVAAIPKLTAIHLSLPLPQSVFVPGLI